MITQAIKDWLHKLFAWWPWKQSAPVEYQHVASAMASGAAPETSLWTSQDETLPQAGATPRRFQFDSRVERLMPQRSEVPEIPPHTRQVAALQPDVDAVSEPNEPSLTSPTPRQRLEFLRYLIQQGIVNEGFAEK